MAKNFFRVENGLKFPGLASAPADLADGDIYFNTTLGKFRQKTGGTESDLGGGGVGDITDIESRLYQALNLSTYEAVTPNVIARDQATKVSATTGTLGTDHYLLDAGEYLTSVQSLDADFLASGKDLTELELAVFYDLSAIDTNPTVQVSRDGGVNFQTINVSRFSGDDAWTGKHVFADEPSFQNLHEYADTNTDSTSFALDATRQIRSQGITMPATQVIQQVTVYLHKNGPTVGGVFTVAIVKDNGSGQPSLAAADEVYQSADIDANALPLGLNTIVLSVPEKIARAGNHHIVIRSNAALQTAANLAWRADSSAPTAPGSAQSYNGTTWATQVYDHTYKVEGRPLDLRIKVTSSMAATKLKGYGILYDKGVSVQGGVYSNEVVTMTTTASPQKVTVGFLPDPDLVEVNDLETGQTFLYPAFVVDGYDIKFPTNPFPTSPTTRQFRVRQSKGASVDNNEKNANLLAENRLGSTNPSLDRSRPGEGILLRASDGQLVEASIVWNGSNYVWQFATV